MKYIVWVSSTMWYLCETQDEVEEKMRLLAQEPANTIVYLFQVSQVSTLARYRQEGFLAG